MKKITSLFLAVFLTVITLTETGCLGQFALTKKLYSWNQKISDNKIIKNVAFWILLPVYEAFGFADIVLFNVLEFWTGKNPLAMAAGEFEIQIVKGKDGNRYQITASRNRFEIKQLDGKEMGRVATLNFNDKNNQWSANASGKEVVVSEMIATNGVYTGMKYFKPDGTTVTKQFDANTQEEMAVAFGKTDVNEMALAK